MYILRDNKTKFVVIVTVTGGWSPPQETAGQCRDSVLRTPLERGWPLLVHVSTDRFFAVRYALSGSLIFRAYLCSCWSVSQQFALFEAL